MLIFFIRILFIARGRTVFYRSFDDVNVYLFITSLKIKNLFLPVLPAF